MLLREIQEAKKNKRAIGHFNVSNLEMFKAILLAANELSEKNGKPIPIILGFSENERKYIGTEQAIAFAQNFKAETNYPIFTSADHCHSQESAEDAARAGFDAVVIDNSRLPLLENIEFTKKTVLALKKIRFDIVTEGEIGFIGASSKILKEIPEGISVNKEQFTTVEDAQKFVMETGVDLFSPAVGNIHGVLKDSSNPALDIEKIKQIAQSMKNPLVLHGASGVSDEDIKKSIEAGISVIHISTELRMAFKNGIESLVTNYFPNHPEEIAPYKIMEPVISSVKEVVVKKLRLFT
ncbi:MAG: class II fructose-bisphosphate aldolase [Candidatus Pacebacteria bacterium]|nr:class II fructose-bisphosphate aldolase [Candidatus Paceibacterota bacterium]